MVEVKSPAVAFVGRHNSGKTTLIVKLIEELVARGVDVGSVKHHSHVGFEIDIPGKDSYRHRHAGASETVIAAPGQMACIKTVEGDIECADIVAGMPGHDIVIVEGYRKSGLPTIEIMREGNPADMKAASAFAQGAREGWPLDSDFTQIGRRVSDDEPRQIDYLDVSEKLPGAATVAVVTDIPCAIEAARAYGIPSFGLDAVSELADFLEERHVRPKVTVVIQAGGESRRMGRSKATVPFGGRPLICRLVDRVSPVADELVVTTNEPDNLAFLLEEYPGLDIRLERDVCDARGALPGLYTAIEVASHPYVAVVACDMIFASPRLIAAEAEALTSSGADAVVPVNKHGYEPFHALYRKSACLPVVKAGVEAGERAAQYVVRHVSVRKFPQSEVLAAEPMGGCFVNANTPEELASFERWYLDA